MNKKATKNSQTTNFNKHKITPSWAQAPNRCEDCGREFDGEYCNCGHVQGVPHYDFVKPHSHDTGLLAIK